MPSKIMNGLAVVAFTTAAGAAAAAADQWPGFRGPNAGVVADNPALPETWSATQNVAWKTALDGFAWSSPIVWNDTVFVTSVVGNEPKPEPNANAGQPHTGGAVRAPSGSYRWILYAIDVETGRIRWERLLHQGVPSNVKQSKNTYASETPVTDGRRVYVYHASAGLFAVDFSGRIEWSRTVPVPQPSKGPAPSPVRPAAASASPTSAEAIFAGMGHAASPALDGNRLFIVDDHDGRQWFVAAFDTATGRSLWQIVEPKVDEAYGWSSPFVWRHEGRTELVAVGNNGVRAYDVERGRPLWNLRGLSMSTSPSPFAAGGLLYASSGYPGDQFRPVYAIRPGASGDISLGAGQTSNEYVKWSLRTGGGYLPSPLVYDGRYYTLYSQGFMTCHDATSGAEIYSRRRIAIGAGAFTASPWAYNGRIFAASEDGDVYVIQAGPEFKVLGKNSLNEMIIATPAVVRRSLIVRTASSLWRIAKS